MYTVYSIYSTISDCIYIGFSKDVGKRIIEHNSGKTKSTKGYKPWVMFFTETCSDRHQAREREKYYKSGIGREKLRSILKGNK